MVARPPIVVNWANGQVVAAGDEALRDHESTHDAVTYSGAMFTRLNW